MADDTCPCCGTTHVSIGDPLVAVCDVLVLRALELIGKRVVRFERSRYQRMNGRAWHEAHLLWSPDSKAIDQGLAEAWDSVAWLLTEHGCCGATPDQVTLVLDRYVRDLCAAMQGHSTTELRYRLSAYVGVPV